jgi:hypothetical protein
MTLEDLGLKGVLKWILNEQCGRLQTGFIWLRIGTSVSEHDNEHFRFHKSRRIS